jgi:hypothetical protein
LKLFPESLYCSNGDCEVTAREHADVLDRRERGLVIVNPPNEKQWAALRDLADAELGVWPLIFSCNIHREIWKASLGRYTPDERRTRLQNKNPFLDSLVRLALQHRFYGGQFALYRDRVCWTSTGAVFHRF